MGRNSDRIHNHNSTNSSNKTSNQSMKNQKTNRNRKLQPKTRGNLPIKRTTKSILRGDFEPPIALIPKHKFEYALNLIKNRINLKDFKELRCLPAIHEMENRKYEVTRDIHIKYLLEARKCVLSKDWNTLARILSVAHPIKNLESTHFFTTYAKYALICLYHNPEHLDLLKSFLTGVISINEDPKQFIKLLTKN